MNERILGRAQSFGGWPRGEVWGMGNVLGNRVIDRHRNSRQCRPQSWYSHLKSFGTVGIQFFKIENYVLHQYLCD